MDEKIEVRSAAISDRGLSEKRPQNEDSFLEIPECGIFAVADGVGGAQAGEVASQMAVEILGEAFLNRDPGADPEDVMREALEKANAAIHQMSTELEQLSQMATTIVAIHVSGNIANIAHAGDSRLYSLKANGEFEQETHDHSMVADEVRAGRMTEEQAENHPGKNIINRALGAEPNVQVDLKTVMVEPGTRFLLCSDGVTRHIDDGELTALLKSSEPLDVICDRIKQICYERGAEDNLTAVIVDIGAGAEPVAVEPGIVLAGGDILDLDDDEPTVAARRPLYDVMAGDPDEELLELDTLDLSDEEETERDVIDTVPITIEEEDTSYIGSLTDEPNIDSSNLAEPAPQTHDVSPSTSEREQTFSIFQQGDEIVDEVPNGGGLGKIASTVALLLIGAIVGLLGAYFYLVGRTQPEPIVPTDKIGDTQPLAGFEEDRRMVDKDPAAAIPNYVNGSTEAEDYFLLGRAYLLTGKFPEARSSFINARKLIAEGHVDPNNKKTLENEIALAMAVTNDTTVQGILQKEIDALKTQPGGPAGQGNGTAANANTAANASR